MVLLGCFASLAAAAPRPEAALLPKTAKYDWPEESVQCTTKGDKPGCYPRLYMIGAMKAGTTSVYQALAGKGKGLEEHVCGYSLDCAANAEKESSRDTGGKNTVDYSDGKFHLAPRSGGKEPHLLGVPNDCWDDVMSSPWKYYGCYTSKDCDSRHFLDASPQYLNAPNASGRLIEFLPSSWVPELRIVVVLREPIARSLSHFNMGTLEGIFAMCSLDYQRVQSEDDIPSMDDEMACDVRMISKCFEVGGKAVPQSGRALDRFHDSDGDGGTRLDLRARALMDSEDNRLFLRALAVVDSEDEATAACLPFCATTTYYNNETLEDTWAQKCAWDAGKCSGCDECDDGSAPVVPTKEASSSSDASPPPPTSHASSGSTNGTWPDFDDDAPNLAGYSKCFDEMEPNAHLTYSILARSLYAPQIRSWHAPMRKELNRSQLLVVQMTDVMEDTHESLKRIGAFYGIGDVNVDELPESNTANDHHKFKAKPVTKISCDLKEKLQKFYAPWNDILVKDLKEARDTGEAPGEEREFKGYAKTDVACE